MSRDSDTGPIHNIPISHSLVKQYKKQMLGDGLPTIPRNMSISLVHGPSEPALISSSIGHLLDRQSTEVADREAVIFPAESVRYTYRELNSRVKVVCRALIAYGIKAGDRIGVFSGNCSRYVEVFLATTRIGAIAVLLNNAYSTTECLNALTSTGR